MEQGLDAGEEVAVTPGFTCHHGLHDFLQYVNTIQIGRGFIVALFLLLLPPPLPAFFLSTRNGLILVVQRLTNYVEGVLHAFAKGVHHSEEDRLRKAGFASFTTSRDSNRLNLTQRVSNTNSYPVHIYDREDVRFVPVLLTNNACSFCEGYLINLLWNRYDVRPRGEFPVGTNKKGVNSNYGDVNLTYMHPGCLYIHSVNA
jgi:hypothetical protein